jgi:hypothetical protein
MKIKELITEGFGHLVICVDVQPAYDTPVASKIIDFVVKQTGPVLMFVNADQDGLTEDTIPSIKAYWEETAGGEYDEELDSYNSNINWNRFKIVDKGYGYLRSWMDHGIEPAVIIAAIREMYAQQVTDSRDLQFPAFNKRTTTQSLIQGAIDEMEDDPLSVGWASIGLLKRFNGAYLVGGGRDECLREVELLMNAFNIKYKRIDSLVY